MRRLPFLVGLLWLSLLATPASARITLEAFFGGEEDPVSSGLRLLEMRIGNVVFEELITAYARDDVVLLPLLELSRRLELGVYRGDTHNRVVGFVLYPSRPFELDLNTGVVTQGEERERYDISHIEIHSDEIYVSAGLLSQWFPIDFSADLAALRLTLRQREPLPYYQRMQRQRRLEQRKEYEYLRESRSQRYTNRYSLLDVPFVDQSFGTSYSRSPDVDAQQRFFYGTHIVGEALWMEGSAYISGTDHDMFQTTRFRLGRKDYYGRLLGPLEAREFYVGDVYPQGTRLISRTRVVRGATVSNVPWHRQLRYDTHSFRGTLPSEWEVEIYHNGLLLDFQSDDAQGLYEFEDVSLYSGTNDFRLVFYGPFGQQREETFHFNIANAMVTPGDLEYRFTAGVDEADYLRSSVDVEMGLHKYLTGTAQFLTLPVGGEATHFTKAGVRTFWGPAFVSLDGIQASDGGRGGLLSAHGAAGPVRMAGRFGLFDDFLSEALYYPGDRLATRSELEFDTRIPQTALPPIGTRISLAQDTFESGASQRRVRTRLGATFPWVTAANQLQYSRNASPRLGVRSFANGNLLLSKRIPGNQIGVSGNVAYQVWPQTQLTQLGANVRLTMADRWNTTFGLGHNLVTGRSNVDAGLTRDFGYVSAGLSSRYHTPGIVSVAARMFLSLGYDSAQQRIHVDSRRSASSGSAVARVFIDTNQNGRLDPGEEVLSDVEFLVNGRASSYATRKDGSAFIRQLPPHIPVELSVDPSSLEDPSLMAVNQGVRFVPRPGKNMVLNFPVIPTGEIEGTVWVIRGDYHANYRDVEVELIDRTTNRVIDTTRTAFDGFYLFSQVKPGQYTVRVSPDQAKRLDLHDQVPRDIEIGTDGPFVHGMDFNLFVGAR